MKKRRIITLLTLVCLIAVGLKLTASQSGIEDVSQHAAEPQLEFEFQVEGEDFVAKLRNAGSEPVSCHYFGWGGEPSSQIVIEVQDERGERMGPIWMCGTGADSGWTVLEPGAVVERHYPPGLLGFRGLEPGSPFYLAVLIQSDGGERTLTSERLSWPRWDALEVRAESGP